MEISMKFYQKIKIDLPYDPDLPLLGIYTKECKLIYKRDTCTCMFIAMSSYGISLDAQQ
jgi:hypothetical protein